MEKNDIKNYLEQLFIRFPELRTSREELLNAYSILKSCFVKSGTLFVCGNGGSSSDADHIVGELCKGFIMKREVPKSVRDTMSQNLGEDASELCDKLQMGLRAISLNTQSALASAYLNDVDPYMIYAQLLFVMGKKEDVLLGISTSGNAKNVMNAMKVAKYEKIPSILLTGAGNGVCEKYAECVVHVPARETYRVQEYHLPIYHTLCMMLEDEFYGKK